MAKQLAPFIGHWSIVSSPDFDDDYLRMEVEPYLELHESEGRLTGEYRVGLQQGGIDDASKRVFPHPRPLPNGEGSRVGVSVLSEVEGSECRVYRWQS